MGCDAPCCREIVREVEGITLGLLLTRRERMRIERLATMRGHSIDIRPMIGFGYDEDIGEPEFIGFYQITNNPCPFLAGSKCEIHGQRPLICRAYPLVMRDFYITGEGRRANVHVVISFDLRCKWVEGIRKSVKLTRLRDSDIVKLGIKREAEAMKSVVDLFVKYMRRYRYRVWYFDLSKDKWVEIEVMEVRERG